MELDFIVFPTPNPKLSHQIRLRDKHKFKTLQIPAQKYETQSTTHSKPTKHKPNYHLDNLRNIIKNHKTNPKQPDLPITLSQNQPQTDRSHQLNQALETLKKLDQSISNTNPQQSEDKLHFTKNTFNKHTTIKKDNSVDQSLNIANNDMDENVANVVQTNQTPFEQKRGRDINTHSNSSDPATFLSPQRIIHYQSVNFSNHNIFTTEKNKKYNQQYLFQNRKSRDIPCILLQNKQKSENNSNSIVIYFHGNGEDMFQALDLLDFLRNYLNVLNIYIF